MWPSKKKNNKKGITIPAGGEIQLSIPPIRFDGEKCLMLIDGSEKQIEEDGFIVEVGADNARPIRVRISPDFKNRTLEATEIIDTEDNREYPKDGPNIQFAGLSCISMDNYEENIKRHIDMINEGILRSNKKIRKRSYILAVALSITTIYQSYIAHVSTGIFRYIYMVLAAVSVLALWLSMTAIRRVNKIDREIKTDREKKDGKDNTIKCSETENTVKCPEMTKVNIIRET